MIKVIKLPCNCAPETKPAYKSKTNWLVNVPLFAVAILASLPDVLNDPTVSANNPLGAGKTKMVLWIVAILNVYLRNFGKQTTLTLKNTLPLTNPPADVMLSNDVQPSNSNYTISNEIPPEAGGVNGRI